jgi:hypothetical protein
MSHELPSTRPASESEAEPKAGAKAEAGAIATDGSAEADVHRVRIDQDDELDRMRYRCPNNHTRWVPTNNHLYCHSCADLADAGEGPEYYELLDVKTSERIAWGRVVLE